MLETFCSGKKASEAVNGKLINLPANKNNFASTRRSMNIETVKLMVESKQGHSNENCDEHMGRMKGEPLFAYSKVLIKGESLSACNEVLTEGKVYSAK